MVDQGVEEIRAEYQCTMLFVMNAVKIAKCLSSQVAINQYIVVAVLRKKAEAIALDLIGEVLMIVVLVEKIRADPHKAI